MDSSPDLKSRIVAQLKSSRVLRLDLSRVEYIDSSGIAVLIQGLKDAQSHGGQFILFSPSKSVREVLDLAMLNQIFTIEDGGGA
jgi:anti-sigma B factor antagonist